MKTAFYILLSTASVCRCLLETHHQDFFTKSSEPSQSGGGGLSMYPLQSSARCCEGSSLSICEHIMTLTCSKSDSAVSNSRDRYNSKAVLCSKRASATLKFTLTCPALPTTSCTLVGVVRPFRIKSPIGRVCKLSYAASNSSASLLSKKFVPYLEFKLFRRAVRFTVSPKTPYFMREGDPIFPAKTLPV